MFNSLQITCWTIIIHYSLKLRAAVGGLPDKDLESFLVDRLFRGSLQTLSYVLFLAFKTSRCMIERGGIAACSNTFWSATCISMYLFLLWVAQLVQGSARSEWHRDLNLSIEKIARLRDVSLQRISQGFLMFVACVCGIFLFSIMSAKEMNTETIVVVGIIGAAASAGVLVSEIITSLQTQKRMLKLSDSGQIAERSTEKEEPVEQCSWFFAGVSFLVTSMPAVLGICSALTLDVKSYRSFVLMLKVILPIVQCSFAMAMFMKPKREDGDYKWFVYFSFFMFAVVTEGAFSVGLFKLGSIKFGVAGILRISMWYAIFWVELKFRESAAKLPPQELSNFLCQSVLVKLTAAIGPLVFFSFETVSCFISQGSLDNEECENTSNASLFYQPTSQY